MTARSDGDFRDLAGEVRAWLVVADSWMVQVSGEKDEDIAGKMRGRE